MDEHEISARVKAYLAIIRGYNSIAYVEPEEQRLGFGEFALLCHLDVESHPVQSSELARYRKVSAAAIPAAVTRLSKLGYAERRRCVGDGRKREVCLTPTGEEYVSRTISELERSISCGTGPVHLATQDLLLAVNKMGSVCLADRDLVLLSLYGSHAEGMTASAIGESLSLSSDSIGASIDKALHACWITTHTFEGSRMYALTASGESRARRTAEKVLSPDKYVDVLFVAKVVQPELGSVAVAQGNLSVANTKEVAEAARESEAHNEVLPDDDGPLLKNNRSLDADERGQLCDLAGRSVYRALFFWRQGHCEQIKLVAFNDCAWSIVLSDEKLDLGCGSTDANTASLLRIYVEDKRRDEQTWDERSSLSVSSSVRSIDVIDYMVAYTFDGRLLSAFAYTQTLVLHLMSGRAAVIDRGPWAEAELGMTITDEPDALVSADDGLRRQMEYELATNYELHLERVTTSIYPTRCVQRTCRI